MHLLGSPPAVPEGALIRPSTWPEPRRPGVFFVSEECAHSMSITNGEQAMTERHVIISSLAAIAMIVTLHAQTPQTERVPGAVQTSSVQMTGEVMWVQGDWLAARMQPDGHF